MAEVKWEGAEAWKVGWPIHRAAMGRVTMIKRRKPTNPLDHSRKLAYCHKKPITRRPFDDPADWK